MSPFPASKIILLFIFLDVVPNILYNCVFLLGFCHSTKIRTVESPKHPQPLGVMTRISLKSYAGLWFRANCTVNLCTRGSTKDLLKYTCDNFQLVDVIDLWSMPECLPTNSCI